MPKARKKMRLVQDNSLIIIGKNLQNIRKRRGITQRELGEKIGLTRESVASYEAGRSNLLITTLLNISSVLKVSVYEILKVESKTTDINITRRWAKRMDIIESFPESVKKHILRTLDDIIKANSRLSILDD
ncbi:MAG: helix-turn-helix domain-containing protein [Treponema sp.]|nr:helix-turn-helix domain-containing protein [Treponema sp.]